MPEGLTAKRKKTLTAVTAFETPASAKDISARLPEMNLATVYRALDYLQREGLIESFIFSCKEEGVLRYYYRAEAPHRHFMHCERCHGFLPLPQCGLQATAKRIEKTYGCKIHSHTVSFSGLCKECARKEKKA